MNLASTGTLETEANVQYLHTLVNGEALCQFDLLSDDVKNTETPLDVDYLLNGLAWYFPPVNSLSKQNLAMRRCMNKACSLKVSRYGAHLIDLNEYFASFTQATMADKIGITELNEILIKSIFLFFFWAGLRDPIACSLFGGGITSQNNVSYP